MKLRSVLEGIGAALLVLMPYYCKFLIPSNLEIYHLQLPLTSLIGGLLVDLLVYSALLTALLLATQHLPPLIQRIVNALFAAFMFWNLVDFANIALIHEQFHIDEWSRVWLRIPIALLILSGALACFFPLWTELFARGVRLVIAAVSFSAVWIVPQLLHIALAHQPLQSPALASPTGLQRSGSDRRIIWILFDELSYHQTFDHPAPGIEVPNFNRLRDGSISFSQLRPAGFYTDRIIPSLFLGKPIDQIRITINGELWYRDQVQQRWFGYDPNATLFALAQRNGWNTGIDGWFIPYCRTLAPVVNRCFWEANLTPVELLGASEKKSVLANAAVMPSRLLSLFSRTTTPEEGQIENYRNIMAHAETMIADKQLQFVFIHIPVPHGPGIFDRRNHSLRPGGTYLDRLVLADDTLGVLTKEVEATSCAANTTLIVSSDHSWRISLSRHSGEWSDEEEHASGGKFDDRPVLLIHFGDREYRRDVHEVLPEMLEHSMVAGMIQGQIKTPEDLSAFIARQ